MAGLQPWRLASICVGRCQLLLSTYDFSLGYSTSCSDLKTTATRMRQRGTAGSAREHCTPCSSELHARLCSATNSHLTHDEADSLSAHDEWRRGQLALAVRARCCICACIGFRRCSARRSRLLSKAASGASSRAARPHAPHAGLLASARAEVPRPGVHAPPCLCWRARCRVCPLPYSGQRAVSHYALSSLVCYDLPLARHLT